METDVRNHIRIFDTTLRDGEQSPGASLTSAEKLEIARHLAALGVDIIEAGFPAASPDDLAAVCQISDDDDARGSVGPRPRNGAPRPLLLRRCRVQYDGRRSLRLGLSGDGLHRRH